MPKKDILNKNKLIQNINNMNENFSELYEQVDNSLKDFLVDNSSIVTDTKTVNVFTITTSDIDKLF